MNRSKELLVGVVILTATVVGVGGTLWLQGASIGQARIPLDVRLESVGQLAEGNLVTYRGVPIGRVSLIQVEPDGGAVRVRLLLNQEVTLPRDAGDPIAALLANHNRVLDERRRRAQLHVI